MKNLFSLFFFLSLIPLLFSCQAKQEEKEKVCFDTNYTDAGIVWKDTLFVYFTYAEELGSAGRVDTFRTVGPLSANALTKIEEILKAQNQSTITVWRFNQFEESIEVIVNINTCEMWSGHTGVFKKEVESE